MPATGVRREDILIEQFLSAYENGSWAPPLSERDSPEKYMDGGVEMIATRKSDGFKIAIEHTLIEPFVGEKTDFYSHYEKLALALKADSTLLVAGTALPRRCGDGDATRASADRVRRGHWPRAGGGSQPGAVAVSLWSPRAACADVSRDGDPVRVRRIDGVLHPSTTRHRHRPRTNRAIRVTKHADAQDGCHPPTPESHLCDGQAGRPQVRQLRR